MISVLHVLIAMGLLWWAGLTIGNWFRDVQSARERFGVGLTVILFRAPFWFIPVCLIALGNGLYKGRRTARLIAIPFDLLFTFVAILKIGTSEMFPFHPVATAMSLLSVIGFAVVSVAVLLRDETRAYIEACETAESPSLFNGKEPAEGGRPPEE